MGGVAPIPLRFVLACLLWAQSVRRPGAWARARLFPAVPVVAGGWGGGAGRAPAPLSGGGRGDHPPFLGGVEAGAPLACGPPGGLGGGGVAPLPPCSPSGGRPAVPYPGLPLVIGAHPPGVRVRSGSRGRPGGGGMRGGPWTAPPGAPSDLNPPSALPEWAMVMGGVMRGAAPILFWCAAVCCPQAWSVRRSGALVWARPLAATPAGAGGRGRWGARCAGPAASPPPPGSGLFWGRGGVPPAPGGRRVTPVALKPGGGARGGWGGCSAAPRPPAPSGVGLPSVVSGAPPRGIPVPWGWPGGRGRRARPGRPPMGPCGGGRREGGGTPPPWFALPPSPGQPLKGPLRLRRPGRRRSAVSRQRAGREPAGGSLGALAAAALPPHPGCSGLSGGDAGPPSLKSASVRSWA